MNYGVVAQTHSFMHYNERLTNQLIIMEGYFCLFIFRIDKNTHLL
jgi:hypothetical protein